MTTSIHSLEFITQQAIEAAQFNSHTEKACPYPFDSSAGQAFCNAFELARRPFDDAISTAAAQEITTHLANPQPHALITASGWSR